MRDKMGRFIKGHPNICKKDTALKISRGLRGKYTEENHCGWKGDDVKYQGLHIWVRKKLGKADKCEECMGLKGSIRYEWANKSGEYKRDLSDWISLCRKCHHEFDEISQKIWETRRINSL